MDAETKAAKEKSHYIPIDELSKDNSNKDALKGKQTLKYYGQRNTRLCLRGRNDIFGRKTGLRRVKIFLYACPI
ncbi:hypothetical protein A9235_05005 [Polynucleobacter sp. MWH-Tro8-2-5-gr]|nr:hypothetical protein A9235_05005 [Polynucleobacter sp. MWH-Tro8-2-5-gr]